VHPGAERRPPVEGLARSPKLIKDLLHQVGSVERVRGVRATYLVQDSLMAADEIEEGDGFDPARHLRVLVGVIRHAPKTLTRDVRTASYQHGFAFMRNTMTATSAHMSQPIRCTSRSDASVLRSARRVLPTSAPSTKKSATDTRNHHMCTNALPAPRRKATPPDTKSATNPRDVHQRRRRKSVRAAAVSLRAHRTTANTGPTPSVAKTAWSVTAQSYDLIARSHACWRRHRECRAPSARRSADRRRRGRW